MRRFLLLPLALLLMAPAPSSGPMGVLNVRGKAPLQSSGGFNPEVSLVPCPNPGMHYVFNGLSWECQDVETGSSDAVTLDTDQTITGKKTFAAAAPVVAYWPFDDTSSAVAVDVVGGHTLTTAEGSSTVQTTSGKYEGAMIFAGTAWLHSTAGATGGVLLPELVRGSYSVEFWATNTWAWPRTVFAILSGTDVYTMVGMSNDGKLVYGATGVTVQPLTSALTTLSDWHHYTVTVRDNGDTQTVTAYVDGAPYYPNVIVPKTTATDTSNVHIGVSVNPGLGAYSPWVGKIDNLRLYSHALAPEAVVEAYGNVLGAPAVTVSVSADGITYGDGSTQRTAPNALGTANLTCASANHVPVWGGSSWSCAAAPTSAAPGNMVTTDTEQVLTGLKQFDAGIRFGGNGFYGTSSRLWGSNYYAFTLQQLNLEAPADITLNSGSVAGSVDGPSKIIFNSRGTMVARFDDREPAGIEFFRSVTLGRYATTSLPATCTNGALVFDSTENVTKVCVGNVWGAVASGGEAPDNMMTTDTPQTITAIKRFDGRVQFGPENYSSASQMWSDDTYSNVNMQAVSDVNINAGAAASTQPGIPATITLKSRDNVVARFNSDGIDLSYPAVFAHYPTALLPSVCTVGAVVFDTTIGELKVCSETNTWAAIASSDPIEETDPLSLHKEGSQLLNGELDALQGLKSGAHITAEGAISSYADMSCVGTFNAGGDAWFSGMLSVAGDLSLGTSTTMCDVSTRGYLRHNQGTVGSTDTLTVCQRDEYGAYAWVDVASLDTGSGGTAEAVTLYTAQTVLGKKTFAADTVVRGTLTVEKTVLQEAFPPTDEHDVLHLKLDEAAGVYTAVDALGGAAFEQVTYGGSGGWGPYTTGVAGVVPGSSAYRFSGGVEGLVGRGDIVPTQFTVSVWFYPEIAPNSYPGIILHKKTATAPYISVGLFHQPNGAVAFKVGAAEFTAATPLTVNQWHHLALVHTGDLSIGYANGIEVGRASGSMDWGLGTYQWGLGYHGGTVQHDKIQGRLDDFRIADIARSPAEIAQHASGIYDTPVHTAHILTDGSAQVKDMSLTTGGITFPDSSVQTTAANAVATADLTACVNGDRLVRDAAGAWYCDGAKRGLCTGLVEALLVGECDNVTCALESSGASPNVSSPHLEAIVATINAQTGDAILVVQQAFLQEPNDVSFRVCNLAGTHEDSEVTIAWQAEGVD